MKEFKIKRDGVVLKINKNWFFLTFENNFIKFEINEEMNITQNLFWYFFNGCSCYLAISKDYEKGLRMCNDGAEIFLDFTEKEKHDLSDFFENVKDYIDEENWDEV